jgi:hypothetical protein
MHDLSLGSPGSASMIYAIGKDNYASKSTTAKAVNGWWRNLQDRQQIALFPWR